MTGSSMAPLDALRTSDADKRANGAILCIAVFLGLEPLVRSLLWWNAPDNFPRSYLHFDTRWLILTVIGLLGVAGLAEARKSALRNRWLTYLAVPWAAAAVLSSLFAVDPILAADWSLWWAINLVFALALLMALRRQPEHAELILVAWCAGFCAYAGVLLAFVLLDPVRPGLIWTGELPGVANVRHLGFEAMVAALVGSLFRPAIGGREQLWLLRMTAISGWAVLFWSGGRGSFLAACAALTGLALLRTRWTPWRIAEIVSLAVAGFSLAILHTPDNAYFGAWRTIGVTTLDTAAQAGADEVTSGRWAIWREAVEVIATNPLIGIGEGQTPLRLVTAQAFAQPHNLFLQAALAWGLLGGPAFLIGIGYALWRAAKRVGGAASISPAVAGFAVALAMVANSMLDGTLFHPRSVTMFLVGICLGLSAHLSQARAPACALED